MSIENMAPVPESGETRRAKKLSKINSAIKKFIVAGLVLEAGFGGYVATRGAENIKARNEVHQSIEEGKKVINETEGQKVPDSVSPDRQKSEEDFDKDFQFEYEQLAHFQEKEKELETLFAYGAPDRADVFKRNLDVSRSRADHLPEKDRAKLKIDFETEFFPRVVEEEFHPQIDSPIETGDGVISPDILRKVIATFPRNWVNGEIKEIAQANSNENPITERGGLVWTTDAAIIQDKVTLFQNIKNHSKDYFVEILGHESGHANDWKSNKRASYEDKLDLLLKVSRRIDSQDKFHSTYAESQLKSNQKDSRINKYLYSQEYWAEICSQYFKDPTQLSIDDFELVDGWVKKADPKYNPTVMTEQRMQILNQIAKK